MEGISMAKLIKEGNSVVITGKNARDVFNGILKSPVIDFDKEAKKVRKCRLRCSENRFVRIFTRKMRNR